MCYTKKRRYGFLPSYRKSLSLDNCVAILTILLSMGLVLHTLAPSVSQSDSVLKNTPPEATEYATKPACDENDVLCLIYKYSAKYGVNTEVALRIAECESQYGKYTHNMAGSTAKGVYMFIDKTWEYTGGGDVLNERENIERFMMYYSDNKHWWVCE